MTTALWRDKIILSFLRNWHIFCLKATHAVLMISGFLRIIYRYTISLQHTFQWSTLLLWWHLSVGPPPRQQVSFYVPSIHPKIENRPKSTITSWLFSWSKHTFYHMVLRKLSASGARERPVICGNVSDREKERKNELGSHMLPNHPPTHASFSGTWYSLPCNLIL